MTIKEIAEKANVSTMTVSNVINNKTKKVSKATAEKIKKIIEENHYTPNLTARSLTSPSSKIIGVVVPLVEFQKHNNLFLDPYLSSMLGIFEETLREKGYFFMFRSVESVDALKNFIDNWNLDGIILVYPFFEDQIEKMMEKIQIPAVYVDSNHTNLDILTVNVDDEKGTYLTTKHLIELGHRDIAFIGDSDNYSIITKRFEGYKKALSESNISLKEDLVYKFLIDYSSGVKAGTDIAQKAIATAAVTVSDSSALGVIEGARSHGYSVPEDLSVTGYDNSFITDYSYPKLTTVDQHIATKAQTVVDLLIDHISKDSKMDNHVLLDVDLIVRNSTSKPKAI